MTLIGRSEVVYGRSLHALMLISCAVVFLMMMTICLDVLLRNVPLIPGMQGVSWANEMSENMLYLVTLLPAPWLLRQGQHIRVDVLIANIPPKIGWSCEWVVDALAFAVCVTLAYYGAQAVAASYRAGSMVIKTLVTPEWWWITPLPIVFVLLAVEVLFRMRRLYLGPRVVRSEAVSAA